jgi:hypothetical protein
MTDKVARVTLPLKVAEALDSLRRQGGGNYEIVAAFIKRRKEIPEIKTLADAFELNKISFDDILNALVNGYEIEKSPEDKVREYYEEMREVFKSTVDGSYDEEYLRGIIHGVVKTLNLLDIKVPGVNVPVPGVNDDV